MKCYKNKLLKKHYLKVDNTHTLYIEERGIKGGIPIIYLHGGPGGGIGESSSIFFDPKKYHLILFEQRGCGRSTPRFELKNNDIFHTAKDIEKIRTYFNFNKIYLFGGSFGSTIALTYAILYPKNVLGLILRGIFLGRNSDTYWLYQKGASYYFPEEHEYFKSLLPIEKQKDIISGYYEIFTSDNNYLKEKAALRWYNYESSIVLLEKNPKILLNKFTKDALDLSLFECHYFYHKTFKDNDNFILDNTNKIKNIPTWIVHGRYDIDCRPNGAYELNKKLANSKLIFTTAGHSQEESETKKALINILDNEIK